MINTVEALQDYLDDILVGKIESSNIAFGELTIEIHPDNWLAVSVALRDSAKSPFEQLIDLCAVDYLAYGDVEWETKSESFSRGVSGKTASRLDFDQVLETTDYDGKRYAVVMHLLSIKSNLRLRVKMYCNDNDIPTADSVVEVWSSANWYEREAFDLFGVLFRGHPDLRRILTDYGFVGYPFRKDFPLVGHVEMRYDEEKGRVVYEPVSIETRVLTPRVIRDDQRFSPAEEVDD